MNQLPERIAITGLTGFVGTHLVHRLQQMDANIVGIVRPTRDPAPLRADGIEVRFADLDESASFAEAFEDIGTLIHLSGLRQVAKMVPVLESAGVKQGIFLSSAGVYTKLKSAGADEKRLGEASLRGSTIQYTILRPSMIYGSPADRNLARLLKILRRTPLVPLPGDGKTLQQPVHVDDLVDAILASLHTPEAARNEYDLGGPEAIPLEKLVRISARAVGKSVKVLRLPLSPTHSAVKAMQRLGVPSPVRPEQILRLNESKAIDIRRAQADLDFRPRPFEQGIHAEANELLDSGPTEIDQLS